MARVGTSASRILRIAFAIVTSRPLISAIAWDRVFLRNRIFKLLISSKTERFKDSDSVMNVGFMPEGFSLALPVIAMKTGPRVQKTKPGKNLVSSAVSDYLIKACSCL